MTSLTKNQQLVLDQLVECKTAKTAYELLDDLRDFGLKAPLQIYRALDKLCALDRVHRLESINSFIACRHDHQEDHDCSFCAFQICENCGRVNEIHDPALTDLLKQQVMKNGFEMTTAHIEISGYCQNCRLS